MILNKNIITIHLFLNNFNISILQYINNEYAKFITILQYQNNTLIKEIENSNQK